MIGSRNPPRPPTRPTIPEITPMLCVYSSEMYLNTEALPTAQAMPITNISAVKTQTLSPGSGRLGRADDVGLRIGQEEQAHQDPASPTR